MKLTQKEIQLLVELVRGGKEIKRFTRGFKKPTKSEIEEDKFCDDLIKKLITYFK